MAEIYQVELSKAAMHDLTKVPAHIAFKLQMWIHGVNTHGLTEMRKVRGYNDELLKGKRQGQRSIRLNKAYRAIYSMRDGELIEFVEVIEVNKHEY